MEHASMTPITQTLRLRAADAMMRGALVLRCDPQTILALCAVVDASEEFLRTQDAYHAVAAELEPDDPRWHEANQENLEAERALRLALEALKKVEG